MADDENELALRGTPTYEAPVLWTLLLGLLAGLSAVLGIWQWIAALRFPLHKPLPVSDPDGPVTVLKPLKGCDAFSESCLQSWFEQDYPAPVQLLFGVASENDPVCEIVHALIARYPGADASLVISPEELGANAKVSQLIQLQRQAKHDLIIVSDADVLVDGNLLRLATTAFVDKQVGMASCLYRLANPGTLAMRWEAIAINADFWSQVLQSNTLKPMDFALGAVMIMRRKALDSVGGFEALANCLADDYQLGHRTAREGWRVELCPIVVECWDPPQGWGAVWRHQLRWARTIRVCQPLPYFFSILNNATLWPLLWLAIRPSALALSAAGALLLLRVAVALHLQARLAPRQSALQFVWLIPVKDLLGAIVWLGSFLGNTIEWRGRKMRLNRDGTVQSVN